MFNPNRPKDLERFYKAAHMSWRTLRPFRRKRQELIESYVGSEYGESGEDRKETVMNLMSMTADAYTISLVANNPRVLVNTHFTELRPFARKFQAQLNQHIMEMDLKTQIARCVLNAFFGVGIMQVCRIESGKLIEVPNPDLEYGVDYPPGTEFNILIDPGQVYAESISLDDFVWDTRATSWEKIEFCYKKYRVPLERVKKDPRFDPAVVRKLRATSKWGHPEYDSDEKPARELSEGKEYDPDELEPMITLRDTWHPEEKRWGTFVDGEEALRPLYFETWDGPERGPFKLLSLLSEVPDNIMPLAPAANMKNLHDLLNALLRKQARQARRQKDVTTFRGDGKDAAIVRDAADGSMVRVMDRDSIEVLKFGGVDQMNLAFSQVVEGLLSRQAGNLDAMAGLGPQSGTARQDMLIHGSVNRREAKMKANVLAFTADVCRDIGHYDWVDAAREVQIEVPVPGLPYSLQQHWTPEEREGDLWQYGFAIEPQSMAYKSSEQRAQELIALITQVYLPMLPMMQQAGLGIDMERLTEILSELNDLPRLREIIVSTGMVPQPEGQPEGASAGPSPPTREYIRRSVPQSANPGSQRTMMMQSLMGMEGNEE